MQRCASIAVEVLDDWNIYSNFLLYQLQLFIWVYAFLKYLKMFDCTALVMLTRKASISRAKKGHVFRFGMFFDGSHI